MGGFGGALGNASFQEPSSPDITSAAQIPDQAQSAVQQTPQQQQLTPGAQKIASGLAAALKKRKPGAVGPKVKAPSELTAAIARARRARPSSEKYGSIKRRKTPDASPGHQSHNPGRALDAG